ncbi:MAG: nucleotidyltransferase family protein [Eubacteriales bacterium]|nr:nucleotidyltransferase family protein [Eubacteriales bacterium]
MENERIYLFNIISSVLKGSAVLYLMDDLDYSTLFEIAKKQDLTNFLCEGLKDIFLPEKVLTAQKEALTEQKTAYRDYNRLLHLLAERSINCMPLGGAALRGLYTDPLLRESRDFDILIHAKDREEAKIFAGKNGFSHVRECKNADYYFKPPATRIALKTDYPGIDLWSRALRQDGGHIYGLSPEDRYVTALYALKMALDTGRGQAKLLADIFVLYFACDHLFDWEYIKNETDSIGLSFFETKIRDMYSALFLENKDKQFDKELFGKLFDDFPKKLPPKYLSPEKEKLIKKVKKALIITGAVLTVLTVSLLIALFNNKYGYKPDDLSGSDISENESNTVNDSSLPDYISYNTGLYYGEIKDGLPEGDGRMEYYSGDIYEGNFSNGVREGYGVYYLATGGRYEGNFENGSMSGKGTFYYANDDIVSGTFAEGLPNGLCKFIYANGSVYEGNLVDGVRDGSGNFAYENGDKYVGLFKDGDKSGEGTYTWANGAVFSGTWEDNEEVEGKYTDSFGTFTGTFKDGKFFGEGKYTYANGDVYTGAFLNGLENDDDGVLVYKTGGKYEGSFVNGVFHGNGTMYLPNGDVVKGGFKNGKLEGEASYYYAAQNITQTVVYKNGEIIEYKSVVK